MKTILVPTDFSKHATNAIDYAALLAEKLHAKLILFHSYHVPVAYADVPAVVVTEQDFELEAEQALKRLMNHVQTLTGNLIQVEYINREGLLVDNLQVVISEMQVDLLVMGTQGATGMEEFLIGSHAAYTLEKVDCPVLVIPATATYKGLHKIMYATDFQFNDFDSINKVAQLAQAYDAEIIITHISTNPTKVEEEDELMDWFMEIAEANITYTKVSYRVYSGDNVLDQINTAIKNLDVDMLCMSTVKRSFFEKLYKSSLTKKMAYHTQVPLLAFHIREANRL